MAALLCGGRSKRGDRGRAKFQTKKKQINHAKSDYEKKLTQPNDSKIAKRYNVRKTTKIAKTKNGSGKMESVATFTQGHCVLSCAATATSTMTTVATQQLVGSVRDHH